MCRKQNQAFFALIAIIAFFSSVNCLLSAYRLILYGVTQKSESDLQLEFQSSQLAFDLAVLLHDLVDLLLQYVLVLEHYG